MRLTQQERSLLQRLFGKRGFKVIWNHGGHSLYVKCIDTEQYTWSRRYMRYVFYAYDFESWIKRAMTAGEEQLKIEIGNFPYVLACEGRNEHEN